MSNRVFKGFKNDSSSEYTQKHINRETISKISPSDSSNTCFKFSQCSTLNINKYTQLKKLETFYNDNTQNFNGQMNQANHLTSTIESGNILINQLVYDISNDLSLNMTTATSINDSNENLIVVVDPSSILFNQECKNLFFIQNSDISYGLTDICGNSANYSIYSEQNLCKLR